MAAHGGAEQNDLKELKDLNVSGLLFHELANALQILMGQCLLLQFDETVSPSVRERLNTIESAVERISALVRRQGRH